MTKKSPRGDGGVRSFVKRDVPQLVRRRGLVTRLLVGDQRAEHGNLTNRHRRIRRLEGDLVALCGRLVIRGNRHGQSIRSLVAANVDQFQLQLVACGFQIGELDRVRRIAANIERADEFRRSRFRQLKLAWRDVHALALCIAPCEKGVDPRSGVLGAVAQGEVRRILSFHIISQIGYMILGLGLMTPLALAGSIFYLIHHIIVKTNLFLISGVMRVVGKSFQLEKLGGLYASRPLLAVCFLIPALSLAGIPPLSGFFAKLALIRASLDTEQFLLALTALIAGILTLVSMTKIWSEAFWKPAPVGARLARLGPRRGALVPIVILCLFTVTIGLSAELFFELASRAAGQLLDPSEYIQAVLGGGP